MKCWELGGRQVAICRLLHKNSAHKYESSLTNDSLTRTTHVEAILGLEVFRYILP